MIHYSQRQNGFDTAFQIHPLPCIASRTFSLATTGTEMSSMLTSCIACWRNVSTRLPSSRSVLRSSANARTTGFQSSRNVCVGNIFLTATYNRLQTYWLKFITNRSDLWSILFHSIPFHFVQHFSSLIPHQFHK